MVHEWELSDKDNLTCLIEGGTYRLTIFLRDETYRVVKRNIFEENDILFYNNDFEMEADAVKFCDVMFNPFVPHVVEDDSSPNHNTAQTGCDYGVDTEYGDNTW